VRVGGRQGALDGAQEVGRLGEAAHPPLALGPERADAGVEQRHPPRAKRREVRLRGGVLVHVVVHRRGDEDRARRGERRAREEVVGQAVGELGDRVRARRGDQEDVGVADELEMAERVVVGWHLVGERAARRVALELAGQDRRAAERRERRRADEPLRGLGLHDAHRVARLRREADDLERLVGGDPAADADQDPGQLPSSLGGPSEAGRASGSGT
jgi:hypothetical protein